MTGLYFGKGDGGWGLGGRADFVLAPPTLSEKWALNSHLAAKVKTVLGGLGKPGLSGRKTTASEPRPVTESQDSADMPLRMTFRGAM